MRGKVTVICPENEVGLVLVPEDPARRQAVVSWALENIPDQDESGLVLASLRASLFGQWITLEYADNRLLPPEGFFPALVQLDAAPGRRDLYVLQWDRRAL
jgi:hypothetical protein